MRTRLALVCLLLIAAPAAAQEATPAPAPAQPEAPAKPESIPIAEISSHAATLDAELAKITAELEESNEVTEVEERLATAVQEVETRGKRLEQVLAGPHQPSDLDSLAAGWETVLRGFAAAERRMTERVAGLEKTIAEIRQRQELWQRTRQAAREAQVPGAVLQEIEGARRALRTTEKALEARRNKALELQTRIRDQSRLARDAVARLDQVRTAQRGRLLVADSEPLWTGSFVRELGRELAAFDEILLHAGEPVVHYARLHPYLLVLHALVIVVLVLAARRANAWLERDLASREPGAELPHSSLHQPVAAGVLVGLSLVNIIHPENPMTMRMLVLLAALAPWRRLLAQQLPRTLRAPLNGLLLLLVLDALRNVTFSAALMSRGLLLTELVLGLVGVAWLRRPQRLALLPGVVSGRAWLRALDLWLRLSLLSFAAGLVAAATGYSNMALLLLVTPLYGSFTATLLMLVVQILDELIGVGVRSGALDRSRLVRDQGPVVRRYVGTGLTAGAIVLWAYWSLTRVAFWEPVWGAARGALSAEVGYGAVSMSLGGLIAFVLTIWVSWLLSRFVSVVIDREVFSRARMPPGVPFALSTLTRYAVLVAGFMIAIGLLGFSLDRMTLVLSALGVGIGFGLQNVINNFVSGLILLFERPVRVGDRVELEGLFGDVTGIGIRASRVRTFDGSDVIVPNGDFISARVINWTLSDTQRRIILPVGVSYGCNPGEVLDVLKGIAPAHPEVLDDPAPEVLFRGFGDSSLDFEIRCWVLRDWLAVTSDLAVSTYDKLKEAGMEIPFPQRDLHLKSVQPEVRKALEGAMKET